MQKIQKIIAYAMLIVFSTVMLVPSSDGDMGSYMDGVMTQLQGLTPKAYEGQERGYFMGGSASVRFDFQNQPLVSFTPPSIKVGCSGIDIVMGGFSYMNFEYLVQKMQGILSAAPAFAFQSALGTLCPSCKDIINSLEAISDMINSLNVDSCKASSAVGGFVGNQVGKMVADNIGRAESPAWFKGLSTTLTDAKNQFGKYMNNATGGKGIDYWDCLGKGGTEATCSKAHGKVNFTTPLMTQVFNELTYYPSLKEFETIFRAFYGDVYQPGSAEHTANDPDWKGTPGIEGDPGCTVTGSLIEGMVFGTYKTKSKPDGKLDSPKCQLVEDSSKGLHEKVKMSLQRVVDSAKAGTAPSQEDIDLINASRIPIYRLISLAVLVERLGGDTQDLFSKLLVDNAAVPIAYDIAFQVIQHVNRSVNNTFGAVKASKSDTDPTKTGEAQIETLISRLNFDLDQSSQRVAQAWQVFRDNFGDAYEREQKMSAMIYQYLTKNKLMDSYMYAKGLR